MATKIRAKSTVKLTSDNGVNTTWGFVKDTPVLSVICDLLMYTCDLDVAEARKRITEILDEKEGK